MGPSASTPHLSRRELIAAAALGLALGVLLTPGLLHWPPRFSMDERSIIYSIDRMFTIECLRQGMWPWWNPYVHCGTAHYAAIHTGVAYPPNWLLYWLPFGMALLSDHLLHRALAFVGMWVLARRIGLRREGAALAASLYAASFYFMIFQVHVPLYQTGCWLPLVAVTALRARDGGRWAAWGAVVLALVFAAGYPQMFLFTLAVYIFLAVRVFPIRRLMPLLFTFTTMVLLTAPLWIPVRDFVKETLRQKLTYEEFISFSPSWQTLAVNVYPAVFGTKLGSALFSRAPESLSEMAPCLSLALIGWALLPLGLAAGRMHLRGRWAVLMAASLLVAWGAMLGLAPLLYSIPVLNQFKVLMRYGLGFLLAGALFAGSGLDALIEPQAGRRRKWALATVGLTLAALAAAGVIAMRDRNPFPQTEGRLAAVMIPWLAAVGVGAAAAAAAWGAGRGRSRRWMIAGLALMALIPGVESLLYHKATHSEWAVTPYIQHPQQSSPIYRALASLRLSYPADHHPGRFLLLFKEIGDYPREAMYPGLNILHRIPGVIFYGPFLPMRLYSYLSLMNTGYVARLNQVLEFGWIEKTGTRFVVAASHQPAVLEELSAPLKTRPRQLSLEAESRDAVLFRVADPVAWVQWVTDYRSYSPAEMVGRNLWSPGLWHQVWLRKRSGKVPQSDRGAAATVTARLRTPYHLIFDVKAEGRGVLVVRERLSEGWGASLDGERARLWEVDTMFMGVAVPPGEHRVELRYRPPRIEVGLAAALAGAALLGAWGWRRRWPGAAWLERQQWPRPMDPGWPATLAARCRRSLLGFLDAAVPRMEPGAPPARWSATDTAIVALLITLKAVMGLAVLAMGFRLLINDEPYRWHLARQWLAQPSLVWGDQVWLGGFFYLTGLGMALFGHSFAFGKLYPLFFSALSIAGLYGLARQLTGRRDAAALAAVLYTAGAVHTWNSVSLLPEPMELCFVLWGMWGLWRGWMEKRPTPALWGALAVGVSTSMRYEAWILAGVLSVLWIARAVLEPPERRLHAADRTTSAASVASGLILMNVYIVFWFAAGWARSGDPLLFLHSSQQTNWTADVSPLGLWNEIQADDGWLFAAGGGATILMLVLGRPAERLFALAVALFTLFFGHTRGLDTSGGIDRMMQVWRALLAVALPFPLIWAVRMSGRAAVRRLAAAVGLAAAVFYCVQQGPALMRFKLWGFSNGTWALADWLRFEANNPSAFKAFAGGRPDIAVAFAGDKVDLTQFLSLEYISSYDRLTWTTDWPREADLVLTLDESGPPSDPPSGWQPMARLSGWTVWKKSP
ncbi:MAG: hypothetical protein Kow0059_02160 [Candidatus Sumerlaeia bacterium]